MCLTIINKEKNHIIIILNFFSVKKKLALASLLKIKNPCLFMSLSLFFFSILRYEFGVSLFSGKKTVDSTISEKQTIDGWQTALIQCSVLKC